MVAAPPAAVSAVAAAAVLAVMTAGKELAAVASTRSGKRPRPALHPYPCHQCPCPNPVHQPLRSNLAARPPLQPRGCALSPAARKCAGQACTSAAPFSSAAATRRPCGAQHLRRATLQTAAHASPSLSLSHTYGSVSTRVEHTPSGNAGGGGRSIGERTDTEKVEKRKSSNRDWLCKNMAHFGSSGLHPQRRGL